MKIIYCSYWATYTAYLMAAIHSGLYRPDKVPSDEMKRNQYLFCCMNEKQYGNLIYIGLTKENQEIYILGCKKNFPVIQQALINMNKIFNIQDDLRFIDVSYLEGIIPRLLSFFNYHSIFPNSSQKLFSYWVKMVYPLCIKKLRKISEGL